MEKKGNKVTQIRTSCGISFRDMTKLLAPSTNLRSFGKLFDLEQVKAHFPFGILSSVEALKLPQLPTEVEAWKSDLTGNEKISAKEIAEAVQLFQASECQNVGDYLTTYLKLDVVILYKAGQEWRRTLRRVVGIDFIETRKYTISSLSNLAGRSDGERQQQRRGKLLPQQQSNLSPFASGNERVNIVFFSHFI